MTKQEIQSKFMDLIFFAQKMSFVTIKIERDGFMISNPQTHTHLTYNADSESWLQKELERLKDFILMAHEYNEQNIQITTHEELKSKGLSSADFLCSGGSVNKALMSQSQRDEYLQAINNLK